MAESRTVLDSEFQKALVEGLRHVGLTKPKNPVHELGNFLLSYRKK